MAAPNGTAAGCAASRFGLRPPRLAAHRKTYTTSRDINALIEQGVVVSRQCVARPTILGFVRR